MEQPRPIMSPAPGEHLLRFVGDTIRFTIRNGNPSDAGTRAFLRTNLGRGAQRRREIIAARAGGVAAAGASWHDIPMQKGGNGWAVDLPLAEPGYFKAKAYLTDQKRWQHWPDGPDAGVSVHPDFARTANTIYCAFARLFGREKNLSQARNEKAEAPLKALDEKKFTVIPPSGTLRDLKAQLPHIVGTLGCRILHLLPIHPTPTVYARFGRFGSPYAALDLTAVDPALVEFDKRSSGVDQFCELAWAAHSRDARVFLDIVINHTGWGSVLQENAPEYFLKTSDGQFASPGAWGVTWEDLVELKHDSVALQERIVGALLTWCRRGVDGFRCDAGYKIPVVNWQYIVARVQDEFPDTIFLLEGLGGSWEATENLLAEGGMQWAYSELFQNYSGRDIAWYLDYANRQNGRLGTYVHYSETHDNSRLAASANTGKQPVAAAAGAALAAASPASTAARQGRAWSLFRNRLCGLTSASGGFGFTCGVEWLATEKIAVHGQAGLNWGARDNLMDELGQLNRLLADHPCFFDGATLTRLSGPESPVYALLRESADGQDAVLVLANTDLEKENRLALDVSDSKLAGSAFQFELLGQPPPALSAKDGELVFTLAPGACYCLAPSEKPNGMAGDDYRSARARAAFAIQNLNRLLPAETLAGLDWQFLAEQLARSPRNFLAAASRMKGGESQDELADFIEMAAAGRIYPNVVTWTLIDARRVTPVPAGHWLLIEDNAPFRARLHVGESQNGPAIHVQSISIGAVHVAAFAPAKIAGPGRLTVERYAATAQNISAAIHFLPAEPVAPAGGVLSPDSVVLLTNGRGGMARIRLDAGSVRSKYDCILGANLHPTLPVDRHIFVKRIRVWINADGFLSALDFKNLNAFDAGPPASWRFTANAGDGRTVDIVMRAEMMPEKNTVRLHFNRPAAQSGRPLPAEGDARLTVRFDIEDRNFHWETKRNGGADHHFASNTRILPPCMGGKSQAGFIFTPARDRRLRIFSDAGLYHPEPEWCENIPHPIEAERGLAASGDAYSPGWFEIPMGKGADATLTVTCEPEATALPEQPDETPPQEPAHIFEGQLVGAARQFVVRREAGKTVIAGYPWFLDWGRDTFISARGLLAGGMRDEVLQLLLTFAAFEKDGTLPNAIYGGDASNRDTSDAPLWFALAVSECAEAPDRRGQPTGPSAFYSTPVGGAQRTLADVLASIAENYARGTPNGIRMDPDSALIWSPAHFSWMDTSFPAATAREGYPVEIQALWVRLLRLLEKIAPGKGSLNWNELAGRAEASFEQLFWMDGNGWFADALLAARGTPARQAVASDALRGNCLFPVTLGLAAGERARRCVAAAEKHLVVPGAVRSLAPLPVTVPLPVYGNDGRLLNNPVEPYCPRYEGDEDTHRKVAYHNGTAWTWLLPNFCEALARAWEFAPEAVAAAKSHLCGAEMTMREGCIGQIPEILDGDAPHAQRGCDAQAWSVTETLRVWKLLEKG
ncbi:MAG: glycogen debranching enzyme N-terminal domain-containing protein [Verrucomicrobia bacterium]|nr:glycogen debranching enzyme N-terminal domain-containing protein [Verrucomicrobiota bacterium]MDE3097907.1 glycogen debranching enzyme N-terminal domain-containing protein [Verrucomicrobiota bacterium]